VSTNPKRAGGNTAPKANAKRSRTHGDMTYHKKNQSNEGPSLRRSVSAFAEIARRVRRKRNTDRQRGYSNLRPVGPRAGWPKTS